MEREIYYIVVTWREGESSIDSLNKDEFEIMRRNMIDDGFDNLQIEWYESGILPLPDRILVFVYWEDPDIAPEYKQVRKWGVEVAKSHCA
jgi:hypothetical protein